MGKGVDGGYRHFSPLRVSLQKENFLVRYMLNIFFLGESYLVAILQAHVQSLIKQESVPAASLKHLLSCTVR